MKMTNDIYTARSTANCSICITKARGSMTKAHFLYARGLVINYLWIMRIRTSITSSRTCSFLLQDIKVVYNTQENIVFTKEALILHMKG